MQFLMKLKAIESTTLDREVLDRSSEPDAAYYIQNQSLVAGQAVDLDKDPQTRHKREKACHYTLA